MSEDDSSTFLCELLPRSIDKFLALVQSYSNRSSGHSQSSTVARVAAKAQKAGVTSLFDTLHAVRLPLLPKHDTSEGMTHWQSNTTVRWPSRGPINIGSTSEHQNAIYSSVMLRGSADVTARTTTSVSTVRMGILSYSCFTASSSWSRIRVSVSS